MKTTTNWLLRIRDFLRSLFQGMNDGYKLSSAGIPDLYSLKDAHNELLQAYVKSLAAVSRLSFLVGMNEVNPPKEGLVSRIFRIIFWSKFSPFRLLVWRPVIKLYIDGHIYKKLQELRSIYTQSVFLIPSPFHIRDEYLAWLVKAKSECDEFRNTIVTRNIFVDVIKFFVVTLVGLSLAIWGATSLYDLLFKILSSPTPPPGFIVIGKLISLTIVVFPFILTFLDAAFAAKRAIFLNINNNASRNVYELENHLFSLLNHGKSKEFPINYSVTAFFYLTLIGFLWLLHLAISQLPRPSYAIILDWTWCLLIPYVFLFFADVIVPWWKREAKGEL